MFGLPIVQISTHIRPTLGEGLGEVDRDIRPRAGYPARVEISGRSDPAGGGGFHHERLLVYLVDIICQSRRDFARAMTDTFAGISPYSVPLFVLGQLLGGGAATLFARWLVGARVATSFDPN